MPVDMEGLEAFMRWLSEHEAVIFVRAKLEDRWQTISLADLDKKSPLTANQWRGLFRDRWITSGGTYYPHVLKEGV